MTDQLPTIDDRQTVLFQSDSGLTYIHNEDGSLYLNLQGRWMPRQQNLDLAFENSWPIEAAALAFLHSLTAQSSPPDAVKERLTSSDPPGWYECETNFRGRTVKRAYWWNGIELRGYEGGHFLCEMNLHTNFRGPLAADARE